MTAATDPAKVGSGRYAAVAIALHWTIAAAILVQVVLASRMEGRSPEAFALVQLHKSVGITILLLSLARLGWRLAHPPPPFPDTMRRWEKRLAALTHAGFYVVMIGMPLTGWIMVSTSRFDIPTLLYGVVPWPHIPGLSGLTGDARAAWHDIGYVGHDLLIKLFWGLIALHVAGALKHQLLSRDEPVLARMAPGARAGRWLEPRLAAIVLGLGAAGAFAALVSPPAPGVRPPAQAQATETPLEALAPDEAVEGEPPEAASAGEPDETAATPDNPPAPEPPSVWRVERGSELGFETAWGEVRIEGVFRRWDAEILFSPEALDASRVRVTIDLASADTGDRQRDEALPGYDWFAVDDHPRATFIATRFERTGEDRYLARGELALRGVTRPVSLPFRLQIDGDRARVRGVTSLDRTAFGIGQGEWASTDQVPARVAVRVDLRARR